MRHLLGISAFYHDSAAALLRDGEIVAAAQEERFTRRKNDDSFPSRAAAYCLREAGLSADQLDAVVFYDKPIPKFARFLETCLALAPGGLGTFLKYAPSWLAEKLDLRSVIRAELDGLPDRVPVLFSAHHPSHAASAFFPSPFARAAVLTVDGVGEYATTTIGRGDGHRLETLEELRFPHSLGLLYSAFTAHCGFRVNSGEYKLMGLAPYGEPRFVDAILGKMLDLRDDGSFWLNPEYFDFLRGFRLTNARFDALLGGPPRDPAARIESRHCDAARSIQFVAEEVMLRLARRAHAVTGEDDLCLAGGVALNCVANGRLLREGPFRRIWIQPAAGDAGAALGAAFAVWHDHAARNGLPERPARDRMQGARLGPRIAEDEAKTTLRAHGAVYERLDDDALLDRVVAWLAAGEIVGWVEGRMEFGPRALGGRSILGDPRSPRMQSAMNLKVKFRESFRPFAPVVRAERAPEFFDLAVESPYMLLVAPVRAGLLRTNEAANTGDDLVARVNQVRSTLPAITHVDGSARVQTVRAEDHPRLDALLRRWEAATGCAVLVNTSFNVRGEPIVCTTDDAYRCFVNTAMDHLVIGNLAMDRDRQPTKPRQIFAPVPD